MYVFGGVIALIDAIMLTFKLPHNAFKSNPKAKIDFIGSGILAVSLVLIILGLTYITGNEWPLWLTIVMTLLGITLFCFFFYYNMKITKNPIFAP